WLEATPPRQESLTTVYREPAATSWHRSPKLNDPGAQCLTRDARLLIMSLAILPPSRCGRLAIPKDDASPCGVSRRMRGVGHPNKGGFLQEARSGSSHGDGLSQLPGAAAGDRGNGLPAARCRQPRAILGPHSPRRERHHTAPSRSARPGTLLSARKGYPRQVL